MCQLLCIRPQMLFQPGHARRSGGDLPHEFLNESSSSLRWWSKESVPQNEQIYLQNFFDLFVVFCFFLMMLQIDLGRVHVHGCSALAAHPIGIFLDHTWLGWSCKRCFHWTVEESVLTNTYGQGRGWLWTSLFLLILTGSSRAPNIGNILL